MLCRLSDLRDKEVVNINNGSCMGCVSDVECFEDGTQFTLTFDGQSRRVKTKLLGAHSAYNIALAAEAAYAVGMGLDEIAEAVPEIGYIEHR